MELERRAIMITATAQRLQRQHQQHRRLNLWEHVLATFMLVLLTTTPGSNAFLGAIPRQARLSSAMTHSPGILKGQFAQAMAPRARTLLWSSVAQERGSMTWGGGRGLSKLQMSAKAAVDVEQKGIVTVYFKETCPHCKKVGQLLCWSSVCSRFFLHHVLHIQTCTTADDRRGPLSNKALAVCRSLGPPAYTSLLFFLVDSGTLSEQQNAVCDRSQSAQQAIWYGTEWYRTQPPGGWADFR